MVPKGTLQHAPTTVGGTADGTRRSTVGTLTMGTWAGTGEALAWDIASDAPSTSPGHRTNSGAHGEAYSMHTYAFKLSCIDVPNRVEGLHRPSSQIGGNGEVRGIYFTFLNDLRYPSLPERLLPRRSLKQLPTLTEVE